VKKQVNVLVETSIKADHTSREKLELGVEGTTSELPGAEEASDIAPLEAFAEEFDLSRLGWPCF